MWNINEQILDPSNIYKQTDAYICSNKSLVVGGSAEPNCFKISNLSNPFKPK